jgi:GNAT superfamily N-acetyltransferase
MNERIRDYQPSDRDQVVALSLRAWAPVFGSMEQVLGKEIFVWLHSHDWRQYQARSVSEVLADDAIRARVAEDDAGVAEDDAGVAGFVAATVFDPERKLGEVVMLAVDPDHQKDGLGTALTEFATNWLRDAGMLAGRDDRDGRRSWTRAGPPGLREGGLHGDPDGQVFHGTMNATSAVSTVPAVRPGAVWYFQ